MARKSPQKTLSQLEQERTTRFQSALDKIQSGQSRKQAILSSGMDPRTFNKRIAPLEDKGTLFLTPIDKKGHYRLSGVNTVYARMAVFREDGAVAYEHVDLDNTKILSRYWNDVRNMLVTGKPLSKQSIYNIYGEKIQLETDYYTIERWHSRLIGDREMRETFNDTIYERIYQVA